MTVELRLRGVSSLKEKRSIVRPVVDGARKRFAVAAAEVASQDAWQLATLGFAAVSGSRSHAESVIDAVERFVWSFLEVDVVSAERAVVSGEES